MKQTKKCLKINNKRIEEENKIQKQKKKHDKISFSSYNMQMSFRRSIRKETEKK